MERHTLLFEWNQTAEDYPRDLCFHQLFEAQVNRTPSAIALEFEDQLLTFDELNNSANSIARQLQCLGVGPEVLVGICTEPSVEMIAGLLGILKVGGAYVPLDPTYPSERLAFMMTDAAPAVVLTQGKLRSILPKTSSVVLELESLTAAAQSPPFSNPVSAVHPENLAYIIYTSGSSGRPKGALIPHRGLVKYLVWAAKAYRVETGIGAPVHSSISFDLTITGLFAPLIAGRRVRLIAGNKGPMALGGVLSGKEIYSLVKITPAHLELLQKQWSKTSMSNAARAFVIGGEALYGEDLAFWQEHMPKAVLVNEYGPTETVVGCCAYFVPIGQRLTGRVPIGRPIANTQLYVLDSAMNPVPLGATGELYIGGDGVARGYLNRPDLTRKSFVSNPFAAAGSKASRLYKTGDHVRYLPDGNLEFIGRIDDQVKVRGYRVEPGEIEGVLTTNPNVKSAKVILREDSSAGQSLVAYVVPRSRPFPSAAELRQFVKQRLPTFMVPACYVVLPSLPLTPNGKVDREALPAPGTELETRADYVSPRNEIERMVTEVWQDVFQREAIGVRDDFFEVGGHSLIGVQLISEINRAFHSNLDVVDLLEQPTIEGLALKLTNRTAMNHPSKLVRLRQGNSGQSIIFLNAPMGVLPLSRLMETSHSMYTDSIPFSPEILQAAAAKDWKALPDNAALAAPHTRHIEEAGIGKHCILAGYSSGGVLAFEVAHQLQRDGFPVDAVLLFDADIHAAGWVRFKRWAKLIASERRSGGIRNAALAARRRIHLEWEKRTARRKDSPGPASLPIVKESSFSSAPPPNEIVARIWAHAHNDYPHRRLASRGVLLRAQDSIYTERSDHDGLLGWSGLFDKGLDVFNIPGGHFSMWKQPGLLGLAKACSAALKSGPAAY